MKTSGWVRKNTPCKHPGRPLPVYEYKNDMWYCADCSSTFSIELVDHGHDTMPGESQTTIHWKKL